jgi:hypothetical protein
MAVASVVQQYYSVYVEYEMYNDSEQWSSRSVLSTNFDENMLEFDEVVNEKLKEGWRTLGPPTFCQKWCNIFSSDGFAIQTLVRDKSIVPVIVVDVHPEVMIAEGVMPLHQSKRCRSKRRED